MSEHQIIHLKINGQATSDKVTADLTVADYLHEKKGLTGTKVSCGIGVCKACTIAARPPGAQQLQRVQACLIPVVALNQHEILTVEGLATDGKLSPQQQAFLRNFSFQCGYCAPGFLIGVTLMMDHLKSNPAKKEDLDTLIMEHLGDHICRCSGYANYYRAIRELLLETPGLLR